MKQVIRSSPFIAGSALLAVLVHPGDVRAAAAPLVDPFRAHVTAALVNDDNVYRLEGSSEGERSIGTGDLEDWHVRLGAGFDSDIEASNQHFELKGDVYERINDRFDELDYTGGRASATWNWRASDATRGDLGYRYRRDLRLFSNRDVPTRDIIQENAVFASVDQRLAQRWSLGFDVDHADLQFSASPQLEKKRLDLQSQLQYDASQDSKFGLVARYTRSNFDSSSERDFAGWSIGPSMEWQYTTALKFSGDLLYTHQSLDDSPPGVDDFDGATGSLVMDWQASDTLRWRVRGFRDISDLGGEVPRYTERTGVAVAPRWKISEKLTGRAELRYERRDFVTFSAATTGREDDWYQADAWLDLEMGLRWLVSAGISAELRNSSEELEEFEDLTAQVVVRFDI